MGLVKTAIIYAIVAVIVYFLLRPTPIELKHNIFITRSPKFVYQHLGDVRLTADSNPFVEFIKLRDQHTNKDGLEEVTYESKHKIPVWGNLGNWSFPVSMDVTVTMTKPGNELEVYYKLWYAMLEGKITRNVKPHLTEVGAGTEVTQTYRVTTPWVTSLFVKGQTDRAHQDSLWHLKHIIESIAE